MTMQALWNGAVIAESDDTVVVNTDAAWYYRTPKSAADNTIGRIAFWPGRGSAGLTGPVPEPPVMLRPGDPVADFTVSDDEGRPWTLSDHRGRPVLLIFHRHLM